MIPTPVRQAVGAESDSWMTHVDDYCIRTLRYWKRLSRVYRLMHRRRRKTRFRDVFVDEFVEQLALFTIQRSALQ